MRPIMKKFFLAILAAMGVHKHLSAEQRHDITMAAMQATPGAVSSGVMKVNAWSLSDLVAVLTAIFIVAQIAHLIWKWRRQARIDAERRLQNKALPSTDWGQP